MKVIDIRQVLKQRGYAKISDWGWEKRLEEYHMQYNAPSVKIGLHKPWYEEQGKHHWAQISIDLTTKGSWEIEEACAVLQELSAIAKKREQLVVDVLDWLLGDNENDSESQ